MVPLSRSTILLGLSLSEQEDNLLKSAVNLAKKTDSRLVIAHVTFPLQTFLYADRDIHPPLFHYDSSIEEISEKACSEKLQAIKTGISAINSQLIETKVVRNDPALGLWQLAKELKASLIVCGFHSKKSISDYLGVSTAIALMSDPPCPILALPLEREFHFNGQIIFADDLQEETLTLLEDACRFIQDIGATQLYHVTVKKISEREINHMVDTVHSAVLLGTLPGDTDFSRSHFVERMTSFQLKLLEQRFQSVSAELRRNVNYRSQVLFGSPSQELKGLVELYQTELAIFGTHKFFHRSTWSFGKLPYHSMVSLGCAVLVIPI